MLRLARIAVVVMAAAALAGAAAAADERVQLALKFEAGDEAEYEVTLSGSGGFRSPDGELVPLGVQGGLGLAYRVVDVLPDGAGRLEVTMPKVHLQMNIGAQRAEFSYHNGRLRWYADGREHVPPDTDPEQLPLLGTPVVVTVAPNGRVSDVAMPHVPALEAAEQAVPGLGLGQMQSLGDPLFPDEAVAVGETWRQSSQLMPFGPSMPISVTTSRTLSSLTQEGAISLARITGHGEAVFRPSPMTVSPGDAQMTVGLPELRKTVTSTEFFNTAQGRLVRADYEVAISTRGALEVGGEEQDVGFEARFHTTVQAR